jgi:hypothetical protein
MRNQVLCLFFALFGLISPTNTELIVPSIDFLNECSLYDTDCEYDPFIGLFCAWDAYAYCLPKAVTAAYLQQQCVTMTNGTEGFCDNIGGHQYFKFAPPLVPNSDFVSACSYYVAPCEIDPDVEPFCAFDADYNCLARNATAGYFHQQCITYNSGTESFCDNTNGDQYFKFGGVLAPIMPPSSIVTTVNYTFKIAMNLSTTEHADISSMINPTVNF